MRYTKKSKLTAISAGSLISDGDCDYSMNKLYDAYLPIDIYSIYTPKCLISPLSKRNSTRDFPKSFPTYVNSFLSLNFAIIYSDSLVIS